MAELWALLGTLLALLSVPGTFELLMLTVGGILLSQRSLPPPLRGRAGVGGKTSRQVQNQDKTLKIPFIFAAVTPHPNPHCH